MIEAPIAAKWPPWPPLLSKWEPPGPVDTGSPGPRCTMRSQRSHRDHLNSEGGNSNAIRGFPGPVTPFDPRPRASFDLISTESKGATRG